MPARSAIPAALDALVALCTAAAVPGGLLDGVAVIDGPPVDEPTEELVLYLGDTPDDGPAVTAQQSFATFGDGAKDEAAAIYCTAISRSGDTDVKAERDRAFGIVAAVEQLLRPGRPGADPRLGGAVQWSDVGGEETYTPVQTDKGCLVEVGFTVLFRARI
ncbi:hypothetical protein [Saccharothrix australiensis]|uniref:Uncharacterized protein n=1 Tax=Saccharothrix australiensis TaxID=2072 RepID=A0A495VNI2_9PSEU|nr:hypothetical protein [Saccharothrix australiensis]RKT49358.1 hypothetical protein C8E97_6737 [Saccharothrix australiensis]